MCFWKWKGKAILVQFEASRFQDSRLMKVVKLSALRTGRFSDHLLPLQSHTHTHTHTHANTHTHTKHTLWSFGPLMDVNGRWSPYKLSKEAPIWIPHKVNQRGSVLLSETWTVTVLWREQFAQETQSEHVQWFAKLPQHFARRNLVNKTVLLSSHRVPLFHYTMFLTTQTVMPYLV